MKITFSALVLLILLGVGVSGIFSIILFEQDSQLSSLQQEMNALRSQVDGVNNALPLALQQKTVPSPKALTQDINGLKSQMEDLEMMMVKRSSRQSQAISDLNGDTRTLRKRSVSLQDSLSAVEGQARDFSQTAAQAVKGTVMVGVKIPVNPSEVPSTESPFPYIFHSPFNRYYVDNPNSFHTLSGSGSIVTREGDVLTNNHVIAGIQGALADPASYCTLFFEDTGIHCAGTPEMEIISFTGEHSSALSIKESPVYDLALLTTKLPGEQRISFGGSGKLVVGQQVAALGNPLGFEFTFTQGAVSALNRDLEADEFSIAGPYWIQTDTPVNGGNSGGPLIDKSGMIIGVITRGIGESDAGLNFAIPAAIAKQEFGLE